MAKRKAQVQARRERSGRRADVWKRERRKGCFWTLTSGVLSLYYTAGARRARRAEQSLALEQRPRRPKRESERFVFVLK